MHATLTQPALHLGKRADYIGFDSCVVRLCHTRRWRLGNIWFVFYGCVPFLQEDSLRNSRMLCYNQLWHFMMKFMGRMGRSF